VEVNTFKTSQEEILPLRNLYLQENNFQIRYNACHERGWTDSYLITYNELKVGYGSIKGNGDINNRDTVFEFYVIPSFRNISAGIFTRLLHVSEARFIECQSNDVLLTTLLYQFGKNINSGVIMFEDHAETGLRADKVLFRKRRDNDIVFEHKVEPVGDFVVELNKEIIATGGFFGHYNMPFADLYMEVKEDHRGKGLGSFLIHEIKKECYLAGRVPAARCNIENIASKATLIKAGFRIAGFLLLASVNDK